MVKAGVLMMAFMAVNAGPATVVGFALSPSSMNARARAGSSLRMAAEGKQRVLVIGGTRFSGLYLTKELHSRGHEVSAVMLRLPYGSCVLACSIFYPHEDLHACANMNIRMHTCCPRFFVSACFLVARPSSRGWTSSALLQLMAFGGPVTLRGNQMPTGPEAWRV